MEIRSQEHVCTKGASLWQDGAAGWGAGPSAEELSTRWLLAPAPAPAGGQPASGLSIGHGDVAGPSSGRSGGTRVPYHPVLRRRRPGRRASERKQAPCVPAGLRRRRMSRPKGLGLRWALRQEQRAGWGRLAQRQGWMWPPRWEGPARLPQCLWTGLLPDRLVSKGGTRAAGCKDKEMPGEEQLIAL